MSLVGAIMVRLSWALRPILEHGYFHYADTFINNPLVDQRQWLTGDKGVGLR
jgi:hypothetical protein